MNTLKSLFFVLIAPVVLITCFSSNQLSSKVARNPAVVSSTLKSSLNSYSVVK